MSLINPQPSRVFLLLISWMFACFAQAEEEGAEHFSFRHLSVEDGLSQVMVTCMIQDKQGFIWLGTKDGLNRYDGYDFKIYRHEPGNSTLISDNYITAMAEDPEGIIWIGTDQGGLNAFDPKTQMFTHYRHDPSREESLSDGTITALYLDRNGFLWIGSSVGLCRLNRTTGRFASLNKLLNRELISPAMNASRVNAIYEDSRGYLWVGTDNGGFAFSPDRETGFDMSHFPSASLPLPKHPINGFWELPSGELLISSNGGLYRYDPAQNLFMRAFENVLGEQGTQGVLGFGGRIWLGLGSSVLVLDPATGHFNSLEPSTATFGRLSNGSINSWLVDRGGLLWLGTMIGVHIYDPHRRFHTFGSSEGLTHNSTYGLLEDDKGQVWVGTIKGGVHRFDPTTRSLHRVPLKGIEEQGLEENDVFVLHQDEGGAVWIGHTGGLARFNPANFKEIQHYGADEKDPDSLWLRRVTDLLDHARDPSLLWVGTEKGLLLLDKNSGHLQRFIHDENDAESMSGNDIQVLFRGTLQERDGIIWIGLEDGGLNAFDPNQGTFRHYLPDQYRNDALSHPRVISLAESSGPQGRQIWVGTRGGGLNVFDPITETFRHIREKDGLPNDTVYGILVDQERYLWLSTNAGLTRFNPENGEMTSYDTFDGLRGREFNTGAYLRTGSGLLFFGGIEGVTYFDPQEIRTNTTPPAIALTDFFLANKVVGVGADSPLRKHISHATKVTLNHRQSVFSFTFAALDYSASMQNRYAYCMEGFSEHWTEASANQRVATYTNLDRGTYRFCVKAANPDGIWNEEGVSVMLKILPSPWLSNWAFVCYLMGIIGLLGVYIHSQKRHLRAMNSELEKQVGFRTKQLDERVHELEALNHIINTIHSDIELPKVVETLMKQGLALFPSVERAAFLIPLGEGRYQFSLTVGYPSVVNGRVIALNAEVLQGLMSRLVLKSGVYFYSGLQTLKTEEGKDFLSSASFVAVHIKHDAREVGVLILSHSRDPKVLADSDLHTLFRYRDTIVSAVVKAKILQDLLEAQKALLTSAHEAGMNESTAHELHNMGNALTATHTSLGLIQELVADDRSIKLLERIRDHKLLTDSSCLGERGHLIVAALERISLAWRRNTEKVVAESTRVREQLHKVTSQLWSRFELTQAGSYLEFVQIDGLLEEVLSLEGYLLHQEGIVVETNLAQVPALLLNRAKLRKVLQCLLENAREAITSKGGNGRISLSTQRQGDSVLLVVADNGAGIAPESISKVFFQGFSTKEGGLGMGLHYSVIVIKEMGGNLAVKSDGPNHGTSVLVTFPCPQESDP